MEKAILQNNVERAIRFSTDPDDNGKATILVDPQALKIEIFTRINGSDSEPTLLGVYSASEVQLGEKE